MENLYLVQPSLEHKQQYEEMMNEWEAFGGRINPGALRRCNEITQPRVSYEKWLTWIEEDRESIQNLLFLTNGTTILGAISTRYTCHGNDGHSGFGIRRIRKCPSNISYMA